MRQVVVTVRNGMGPLIWKRGPTRDCTDDFRAVNMAAGILCNAHNRSRRTGDPGEVRVFVEAYAPCPEQRSLPL